MNTTTTTNKHLDPTTWAGLTPTHPAVSEARENVTAAYEEYKAVCEMNEQYNGIFQEAVDAAFDRWMFAQVMLDQTPVAIELPACGILPEKV